MRDLIVSLNNNILKLTLIGDAGVQNLNFEVPNTCVQDTKILDKEQFAELVLGQISNLTGVSKKKLNLNIVCEPNDVVLRFISSTKNDTVQEDQLIADIKTKLDDISLDDLYFSYRKLAPFIYQFVGVRKDTLETYIEVANLMGISLKSVLPWTLLLPKYVMSKDPAIFVSKIDGDQVVALSELKGVFYTGVYAKEKTMTELASFVKEISLYKRNNPIKSIYTMNYPELSVDGFTVTQLELPVEDRTIVTGFETNILVNYMIDTHPEMLDTQSNLLNLLPVPAVKARAPMAVYAGVGAAVLLLVGGVFTYFTVLKKPQTPDNAQIAENTQETNTDVLSESDNKPEEAPEVLKKEDLLIMIENGAGVAGLAGRAQTYLEDKDYKIADVGNADEITDKTILSFKKGYLKYQDFLNEDTKEVLPSVEVNEDLPEDSEYNLLIILGTSSEL